MILQFDLTRLDFFRRECLQKSLDEIQSENVGEIIVLAVDSPDEFLVLAGDTLEYVCGLVYQENVTGDIAGNNLSKRRILRK